MNVFQKPPIVLYLNYWATNSLSYIGKTYRVWGEIVLVLFGKERAWALHFYKNLLVGSHIGFLVGGLVQFALARPERKRKEGRGII